MDRRTRYTRQAIKDALFELLEEKHLAQITVKELCARADINRATFYRNYADIYDLFEKLEGELTAEVFESGDLEEDRYRLLEVVYKNQPFYREFFANGLESPTIKKTVGALYDQMAELLKARRVYDERSFEIAYQYNYHGVIGVLREWLLDGCPETPRELGDVLYAIVEKQYR